mmetsp:Transcript_50207/g.94048  ORF Transcript_50207/g.94048 Transcript_50207/m.94048 type:complete len:286 (+) Transcript_50207:60-917(+)
MQYPCGESRDNEVRKWWHVPDDALEALVQSMASGQGGKTQLGPARKLPVPSASKRGNATRQSVRFDYGDLHSEDALDRELRLNADKTALSPKLGTAASASIEINTKRKQAKSWKVSDDELINFIHEKAKATAAQGVVMEAEVGGHLAPVGRMLLTGTVRRCSHCGLRNCPDCSSPGSPGAASSSRAGSAAPLRRQDGHSMVRRKVGQLRDCQSQSDLEKRPPWDKNISCRYFAKVGEGLDGKGNKVLKNKGTKFEHNAIYLSDRSSVELSRVRERVTGHAQYMNR